MTAELAKRQARWPARLRSETLTKFLENMYAIVDIASQQFKVEAGMDIFVNRLAAHNGESVEFDKVLLIDEAGAVKVGTPYVEGAVVKATVVDPPPPRHNVRFIPACRGCSRRLFCRSTPIQGNRP